MKNILLILITMLLVACSKTEEVSFDTLETARLQAKENAEFNAKSWRSTMINSSEIDIIGRGDSTQSPSCPQCDGWATFTVLDKNTIKELYKLKCSTVSSAISCLSDDDFKKTSYGNDDGNCQPVTKVPHPIPKIVQ